MPVMQEALFAPPVFDVRRGDVWQMGRHRLMCGDAQRANDVATLFAGATADIVVTSPPYADCRDYTAKIPCWDSLMLAVFAAVPCHSHTQLLINLGVIHRKNEWVPYWWEWAQSMRRRGWRHYSMYVWDKLTAAPGAFAGRLKPAHEFIFHFNKNTVRANAWMPTKHPGHMRKYRQDVRDKDGVAYRRHKRPAAKTKVPDNVIRHLPVLVHEASGHPAQYPASFAAYIIKTWGQDHETVFDPFCGSGTTIIAAETLGRIGYGMEIAPEYVEIALSRWAALYPDQPPTRVACP